MRVEFDTQCFPEQQNGMLICGINWGGDPTESRGDPDRGRYYRSFFSDGSPWVMNACRYRARILSWLKILGLPLSSDPATSGGLERSVAQVNWLDTQARDTEGQDTGKVCSESHDFFFNHLTYLRPTVLVFISTQLLRALNSPACLPRAEQICGQSAAPEIWSGTQLKANGKLHPPLNVGLQKFANCAVIALPHPAYQGGVEDEYIRLFVDRLGPVFAEYRKRHDG